MIEVDGKVLNIYEIDGIKYYKINELNRLLGYASFYNRNSSIIRKIKSLNLLEIEIEGKKHKVGKVDELIGVLEKLIQLISDPTSKSEKLINLHNQVIDKAKKLIEKLIKPEIDNIYCVSPGDSIEVYNLGNKKVISLSNLIKHLDCKKEIIKYNIPIIGNYIEVEYVEILANIKHNTVMSNWYKTNIGGDVNKMKKDIMVFTYKNTSHTITIWKDMFQGKLVPCFAPTDLANIIKEEYKKGSKFYELLRKYKPVSNEKDKSSCFHRLKLEDLTSILEELIDNTSYISKKALLTGVLKWVKNVILVKNTDTTVSSNLELKNSKINSELIIEIDKLAESISNTFHIEKEKTLKTAIQLKEKELLVNLSPLKELIEIEKGE